MSRRIRIGVLAAALFSLGGMAYLRANPSCQTYVPSNATLVAHAGGGLPDGTYTNSREAIDLAARHSFELIEIDFLERDGRLLIGHDEGRLSRLTVAELLAWLEAHPAISIVTDIKTDNLRGLALLKQAAGVRIDRFLPQIYHPAQYGPVAAMGYRSPILTIYRLPAEVEWRDAANRLPLYAVTMPYDRREAAQGVQHKVFLHTVNEPIEGFGLYTDCLIPAGGQRA
jgi:glycerophosphoryl diester phosphodiesterase